MTVHRFSGGGAGDPIPTGTHSTSVDTLARLRTTSRSASVLPDTEAGTRDFAVGSDIGWWDFGHGSGYLATTVCGRPSTGALGDLNCSLAADDDVLQPSWRNANTATGYALTVAAAVYFHDGFSPTSASIFQHCASNGAGQEYFLGVNTSGVLYVGRDTAAGWDSTGSQGNVTVGKWYHIIYTQDAAGTAGAVWVDGVKSTWTSAVSNQAVTANRTRLAYYYGAPKTVSFFDVIYEGAECSDARAAELLSDIAIA